MDVLCNEVKPAYSEYGIRDKVYQLASNLSLIIYTLNVSVVIFIIFFFFVARLDLLIVLQT